MSKYARFDPENKKANRKKNQYLGRKNAPRKQTDQIVGRFHKAEMLNVMDDYDDTQYE